MSDLLAAIVAVVAALGAGWWYGGKRSADAAAKKQAKADAQLTKKAKETRDEVGGLSDDDVDRRLRKWAGKP